MVTRPFHWKPSRAHADPVADRAVVALDDIEMLFGRVHDDGARRLVGPEEDKLPLPGT